MCCFFIGLRGVVLIFGTGSYSASLTGLSRSFLGVDVQASNDVHVAGICLQ